MGEPTEQERALAQHILDRTEAHKGHGGWYETDEGLRCRLDGELVIPSPRWLDE